MPARARSRPWRTGVVGVVAGVVAVLVLLGAVACTSGSSPAHAPTVAEVTQLLNRHAAAVLHKSSRDFLADVDSDSSAAAFRGAQTAQIAALSDVPLAAWAYRVDEPATDANAVAAATKRLGAPATIVHISLSYRLAVGDPQPSVHDLWWTFVRRHGEVRAAADDDLANAGGAGWQGPWDFGPLAVRRSATSLVLAHPQSGVDLDALLAACDAAIREVTSVVGSGWPRQAVVVLTGTDAEMQALGGAGSTSSGDVAADAVFDAAPGPDGAPTGARVLVPQSTWQRLNPLGRAITLRHELTHVALAQSTTFNTARWVAEGMAEYVANLRTGQAPRQAAPELRTQLARAGVPAALPTDAAFAAGGAAAYEQAWLACRLIADRAGVAGLLRFYRTVGSTAAPGDGPVAAALRAVLHESVASFTSAWREYLRTVLR